MKPMAVPLFVVAILLLAQPDLGSVVVMFVTSPRDTVPGRCPGWLQFPSVSSWWGERPVVTLIITRSPTRIRQGDLLPDPGPIPLAGLSAADQSPDGLWSGSWFWRGLSNSIQKMEAFHEFHTDFVFAILGKSWPT